MKKKTLLLVDESFVPLAQRTIVLYWRLSDFRRRSYQDLAVGNAIPIFWQQQQIDHKSQQELMGLDVIIKLDRKDILFPKLFWPTVRKVVIVIKKNCWNLRLKAQNLQIFWDYYWHDFVSKRSIFQTFWKLHCCTKPLFFC